jgi:threonine-phosphate decarboxylase
VIFHQAHGGQLRRVADHFGIPVEQLLDFSANINPEGPPAEVAFRLRAVLEQTSMLSDYPDLQEIELRQSRAGGCGGGAQQKRVGQPVVAPMD